MKNVPTLTLYTATKLRSRLYFRFPRNCRRPPGEPELRKHSCQNSDTVAEEGVETDINYLQWEVAHRTAIAGKKYLAASVEQNLNRQHKINKCKQKTSKMKAIYLQTNQRKIASRNTNLAKISRVLVGTV